MGGYTDIVRLLLDRDVDINIYDWVRHWQLGSIIAPGFCSCSRMSPCEMQGLPWVLGTRDNSHHT